MKDPTADRVFVLVAVVLYLLNRALLPAIASAAGQRYRNSARLFVDFDFDDEDCPA
jgi:hypothetical protein